MGGSDKKWRIFSLVGISIFMSTLDSSIVNLALPYVMADLSASMGVGQWVVLAYLLTVSSLLLTFGRLSDIFGRKFVYLGGFSLFTLGSLMCGMAWDPLVLIGARVVQGGGAAMLMACSPALVVDSFEREQRGKVLGLVGAVVAAGLTAGPLAGGLILEYFSWRLVFYINIPIGVLAILLGVFWLEPGTNQDPEPMDTKGSLLMVPLVCFLIIGVSRTPSWGIFSLKTAACMTASLVAGLGFILNGKRQPFPLFDPGLLKIRLFFIPLVASCFLFASLFVMVFMMPFYLTYPCALSAAGTGMMMIVPFVCLLVISPVAGILADKMGSRLLCTSGMGAMAVSLFSLALLSPGSGTLRMVLSLALSGIGTALFVSPNNTTIMGAVPPERRGVASGAVATARNLGMVTGVALAGAVFSWSFPLQARGMEEFSSLWTLPFMTGFKRAMVAGSLVAVLGTILAYARGKDKQF